MKNRVPPASGKILNHAIVLLAVFFIGFALSSGIILDGAKRLSDKTMPGIKDRLYHHISTLERDARHYFILPSGGYVKELFTKPLSFTALTVILLYSVFNILFQPVFLCIFTPQVVLNVLSLPFFLYGTVVYFKKVWPLLILFVVLSFNIAVYDAVVEAIIRHGMSCELIYLLISLGGFTGWITRNS